MLKHFKLLLHSTVQINTNSNLFRKVIFLFILWLSTSYIRTLQAPESELTVQLSLICLGDIASASTPVVRKSVSSVQTTNWTSWGMSQTCPSLTQPCPQPTMLLPLKQHCHLMVLLATSTLSSSWPPPPAWVPWRCFMACLRHPALAVQIGL